MSSLKSSLRGIERAWRRRGLRSRVGAGPRTSVGRGWITAYGLAMTGVAAGWFGPIQVLLPEQAERMAGAGGKEALLSSTAGWGAATALVVTPLWGLLSDRLRGRFGRRRPILVAGTVLGVGGLVLLAGADDRTAMVVGWIIAQAGLNGPLVALAALLGDHVPERQRGTVGALFGVAQIAGVVLGTAVAVVAGSVGAGYAALAVAVPLLVAPLLLVHRDSAAPATGKWRLPRITGQFAWAWLIRFLLNLVNALLLVYLYYYLADEVGVAAPDTVVLVVTVVNVLVTAVLATGGGILSDRRQRRRVFVVAGAVVLAAGSALLALLPELPAVLVAAVLVGAGWGLFVAVDLAVVTQVLPAADSRGTAMGVANVAASLPQVVAPVIAGLLVPGRGGYPALYLLTALVAVAAVVCVPRLRTVS